MTNKEKILELSWNTNDILSQYIAIHDDVFKTSIRHIIPIPGIFKSIDFGEYSKKIEGIIPQLESCNREIKSLVNDLTSDEQEYLDLLCKYVSALIETVSRLKIVLDALYAKSKSFSNSNYDWKNYKNDLARYDESVESYKAIGGQLNDLFEKAKASDSIDNAQENVAQFSSREFIQIAEIVKQFCEKGLSENPPKFVIFMGGIASGKTTIRRKQFAYGYVHFDFGEIHLAFEKSIGKNNPKISESAAVASDMILRESIENRKNIVIEIIGDNYDVITPVINKMKEIGYEISIQAITADIIESRQRHLKAVEEDEDYISAYFTQEATLSAFYHQLGLGQMPTLSQS